MPRDINGPNRACVGKVLRAATGALRGLAEASRVRGRTQLIGLGSGILRRFCCALCHGFIESWLGEQAQGFQRADMSD